MYAYNYCPPTELFPTPSLQLGLIAGVVATFRLTVSVPLSVVSLFRKVGCRLRVMRLKAKV
ncbi:hypothetical protein L211DRAFT_840635 [Terfezia boudieri ATCC MYA-4762]|uniref:Uncharacterized protein n=1 Tax=Terfezia boudieri ATCC MYA-4762 TaxID=1051890 RepID=A0A3N4LJ15_9PEZI|nr:hypothetical protein L211DRAFT_840635 [Terfezia boudieri ATCC MYA-4762]